MLITVLLFVYANNQFGTQRNRFSKWVEKSKVDINCIRSGFYIDNDIGRAQSSKPVIRINKQQHRDQHVLIPRNTNFYELLGNFCSWPPVNWNRFFGVKNRFFAKQTTIGMVSEASLVRPPIFMIIRASTKIDLKTGFCGLKTGFSRN